MSNQLPPAPKGFAWMPCEPRMVGGPERQHAWREQFHGWIMVEANPGRAGSWLGAARLMRRIKLEENVQPLRGDRCWHFGPDAWSDDGTYRGPNGEYDSRRPGFWYAPVRFAGRVPDFGETGRRYLDEGEECDGDGGAEWYEDVMTVPITLPPLPDDGDWLGHKHDNRQVNTERVRPANAAIIEGLRTEVETLRAQLAEVTQEKERTEEYARDLQKKWWAIRKALGAAGEGDMVAFARKLVAQRDALTRGIKDALEDFDTQPRECWPEYVEQLRTMIRT